MPVSEGGRLASPGVKFPPPLVFVLPFFASFLLNDRVEFLIVGAGASAAQVTIGTAMLAAGLLLMAWGLVTFVRLRTSVLPFKPARALAVARPYTFSRNPMYVGLMIAYLGGAAATNWAWPLVFLPLVILVMNGFIISREERYLRSAFGAEYDDYCRRVRRWL
jgi:protein-S-isoprenylcysteine O-methyltransferase Ste14